MRLRERRSPVAIGVDAMPPPSPLSRVTQISYLIVLLAVVAYVAWLGWRFYTRLELRGVIVSETIAVAATRQGQVGLSVERGQTVKAGQTLAVIDPVLGCEMSISEDSRLEQVRHQLRVAEQREDLSRELLEQEQARSPQGEVRRALELDGSRGSDVRNWQRRVQELEADVALQQATRRSLEQRQAEILAQAALGNTLAPECRRQSLVAPRDGTVLSIMRREGEFIDRGTALLTLEPDGADVFVEVFPEAEDLGALMPGKTVRVMGPDGELDRGDIVDVRAASQSYTDLDTAAYVPVLIPLRVRVDPGDDATAARWRSLLQVEVEVVIPR